MRTISSGPPRLRAIYAPYADVEYGNETKALAKQATAAGLNTGGYSPPGQSVTRFFEYTGSVQKVRSMMLADEINAAREDDSVSDGLLYVSSPGGDVAGTDELAEAVYRFAKVKHLTAYVDDLCASAGYYFASQASRLVCNTTASVGSIGVFQVVVDASESLACEGIKIVVVRSGAAKGAFTDGLKISDDDLERLQAHVDQLARIFMARVARGRRLSVQRVADFATGEVWIGEAAKAIGLVDDVVPSFEDVLAEFAERKANTQLAPAGPVAENKQRYISTTACSHPVWKYR